MLVVYLDENPSFESHCNHGITKNFPVQLYHQPVKKPNPLLNPYQALKQVNQNNNNTKTPSTPVKSRFWHPPPSTISSLLPRA